MSPSGSGQRISSLRSGSPRAGPTTGGALTLYGAVVLIGVPVAIGTALNRCLARVEAQDGPPNLFAAAFGAGEARDAFDFAYQRWRKDGGYVIVELVGHSEQQPRLVGGIYGKGSAVGQTPSPHDVYLESLCTVAVDAHGIRSLVDRVEPRQGVYIAASQIVRIDLLPPGASATIES
jgi:hypothetical protein